MRVPDAFRAVLDSIPPLDVHTTIGTWVILILTVVVVVSVAALMRAFFPIEPSVALRSVDMSRPLQSDIEEAS